MAIHKKELPLAMGQKVTIKVRGEVFTVMVRGWRKGQYIVLDLPRVGVEDFRIAPQTGIQGHYTKEGVFVNFKSTSILSFVQAVTLLVIEYPRNFDAHNLRKHERFKAYFPVRYSYNLGEQKLEGSGIVRDISSGGLLFTHSKQLEKDNLLNLEFEVPKCGAVSIQSVEIRNLRQNPKSEASKFVTGVKWVGLSGEAEAAISRFFEMRTSERRGEGR
tara:strand:+ start:918 stop:1568 length:651 start_codon:yes stop_codon:yes gene_type:complete